MAEVSRLTALVASRMKVDFVASISHELRSPLHGILASVEFLQDDTLSGMQAEMVNTIVRYCSFLSCCLSLNIIEFLWQNSFGYNKPRTGVFEIEQKDKAKEIKISTWKAKIGST